MTHSKSSDPKAPGKLSRDENETTQSQASPQAFLVNESSAQSDWELVYWIIPASVVLGLAICVAWFANRRSKGEQKIVIDTTKPIRGAFQKRISTPATTLASSEEPLSGNSELLLPREDQDSTHPSASGTERSLSDEFIPRRKPMTDGATERDLSDQHSSASETADQTSETETGHPARPNLGDRHRASRIEADESEWMYMDDEEIEQTASGLDDSRTQAPQPLKPSLAAQSAAREAGLSELSWKTNEADAEFPEDLELTPSRAPMHGSLDPSATQDEQPKSGVFKRWFSKRPKDAIHPITPMENTPHEVDKFQIPDEDLRSLFEKSTPESSSTAPPEQFTDFDADFDQPGDQPGDRPGDGLGGSQVPDSFDLEPDDPDHRLTQEDDDFNLDFDSDEWIEDTSTRRQIAQLEAALAQLHTENRQLHASLQIAHRDWEGFAAQQNHQLEEHRLEQETAASELAIHLEIIARLEAEQLELLNARDSLRIEVEERVSSVQQIEEERIANSQATQALHDSLAQLQLELQAVIRQRDAVQQERDQFQSELQVAAPQAEARNAQLQQLQTENLGLKEQLSNAETKSDKFARQNEALELQIQQLQQEQEQALQKAAQWEQQGLQGDLDREQLQSEKRDLTDKLSVSEQKLGELAHQHEALDNQIQQLRQVQEAALQQVSTWEQQRQTWDAELRQLQTDKRNLNEQLSTTELSFRELTHQQETLELQIQELRQEREQLTSQVNHLQQQLSDMAATQAKAADASSSESISRQTKEKFTRLFKSYERERRLRKEAEQLLTEAEQQIIQLRDAAKKPKKPKTS